MYYVTFSTIRRMKPRYLKAIITYMCKTISSVPLKPMIHIVFWRYHLLVIEWFLSPVPLTILSLNRSISLHTLSF